MATGGCYRNGVTAVSDVLWRLRDIESTGGGSSYRGPWPDNYEKKTEIKSYSEIPAEMGTKIL
jgi:hypothetical protein